jgi:hypothetical protein
MQIKEMMIDPYYKELDEKKEDIAL